MLARTGCLARAVCHSVEALETRPTPGQGGAQQAGVRAGTSSLRHRGVDLLDHVHPSHLNLALLSSSSSVCGSTGRWSHKVQLCTTLISRPGQGWQRAGERAGASCSIEESIYWTRSPWPEPCSAPVCAHWLPEGQLGGGAAGMVCLLGQDDLQLLLLLLRRSQRLLLCALLARVWWW